jgi:outer membrane protein assembly factor BamD
MSIKKVQYFLPLALILLIVQPSCKYQKIKKSKDSKVKYEAAVKYFEEKEYGRALTLFEDVMAIYKGTEEGQDVLFKYSYCNYYLEDYILAGYYFRKFAETYPNAKNTEESRYMSAYCYFLDAPKYKLDQGTTNKALQEYQFFISKYPNSSRIAECNETIDKLRYRLEIKSYESAKLYLKIGYYNAAVISFKNCLTEFPDTQFEEEILYDILIAQNMYAEKSVSEKQKERYTETVATYNDLVKKYPATKHLKSAEKINADALQKLTKL